MKNGGKQCFRCGSPQHLAGKCSHVESTCNYCGKPGILAEACFKKKKIAGNNTTHHQGGAREFSPFFVQFI